mgnify:FL=1
MNNQPEYLIVDSINYAIEKSPFNEINRDDLSISSDNIKQIISSSFWSPQKRCINTVNQNNVLLMHSEKDAFKYLSETHGKVFSKKHFYEFAQKHKIADKHLSKLIKDISMIVMDYLKLHSQRSNISMYIDMFAKKPRIEMKDETARVVFTHTPYVSESIVNKHVVEDYKNHFPLIDEVLLFLVASRFARDRKKSYLWFKCSSDWGKGFFMGLLNSLELSVELSVKEIESMFEGKPAGRSIIDFKKAIVIMIDEFKTVKSELKQLQSEISIAPKNQLSFKVQVYAKLFFSAENVNSLVGEYGVEDQFINRFNFLDLTGDLTKRPLFKELGSGAYFDGLQPYIVNYMNQAIDKKVKAGKVKAELEAEQYLRSFMQKYGLEQRYSRLSKGLNDIARDIAKEINQQADTNYSNIKRTEKGLYLKKPAKYIENYIDENFSYSDKATITKKRDEIMVLLSENGNGSSVHRISMYEAPERAILISKKLIAEQDCNLET